MQRHSCVTCCVRYTCKIGCCSSHMTWVGSTKCTCLVTPSKPPSTGVLQKANGQTSKAQEGKPKSKGKGTGSEAEKAPKAPRAKNAYMFFTADKRDAVKGEWMSYLLACALPPGLAESCSCQVVGTPCLLVQHSTAAWVHTLRLTYE